MTIFWFTKQTANQLAWSHFNLTEFIHYTFWYRKSITELIKRVSPPLQGEQYYIKYEHCERNIDVHAKMQLSHTTLLYISYNISRKSASWQ